MKKIVIAMLVLSVLVPIASNASSRLWPFEKKCLVELETATWCGFCPVAEKALAALQNEYDPSDLTVYALHYNDAFQNSHGKARMKEYGSIATPTAIFNGSTYHIGGDPQCKQIYTRKINEQLGFFSPFSIRLSGKVDGSSLVLTATVMVWKNLPDADFFFTFLIGEIEAKAGGERAFWVLREARPNPVGTRTRLDPMSVYEFTYTYPLGAADPKNIFASFLIESFDDQNIFQSGTWRYGNLEVESIDPVPGSILSEPPVKLSFKMKERVKEASKWVFLDEDRSEIEASISIKDNTVTITPKSKLKKGFNYFFSFTDGKAGLKSESLKFTHSPVFTHFSIKGGKEPPPTPPDPPTPPIPPAPPQPKPPILTVEPLGFNLGKIDRTRQTEFEFTIGNAGDGIISGQVGTDCDYIRLEPSTFEKTPAKIKGIVDLAKILPGQDYKCVIDVTSVAGIAKIGVKFSVPANPPMLSFSPARLDFGKEYSKPLKITIINEGESQMITRATPDQSWIIVAPDILTNSGEFIVAIDPSTLRPGTSNGKIRIESSGCTGFHEIPVTVEVEEPAKPIIIEMVIGNRLAIVEGKIVEMKVAPQIIDGTTLVPFRFVAESFRASVAWDQKTKTVTLEFASKSLKIMISEGKSEVTVIKNGIQRSETLSVPPKNIQGNLCVPIRFFAQTLGAKTVWEMAAKKITISWIP